MRKLETKGIIQQYTIRVDPKKLGKEVIAMVGIDTTPESYMKIVDDMGKRSEVKAGHTVSGDHMIQLECWFENSEKFKEFMQELEDMKGITRLCPGVVLEKFK
ncbi:Lrp/AsnC family transcriptional regulator [Candidatus Woesearchaeota archaeon]|nr:Lrp/AsnC family transcriptional regulator [Candidatus Woesearchaeota archaeon]